MRALKKKSAAINIIGVGGDKMSSEGLRSLFPMSELSLMGFLEIIPHIPKLLSRINQTVDEIMSKSPDVVVTIDSPGFNFKVVKKLRARGYSAKIIHYVAPTVWAYKPERAFKVASLYDHQILILPFEISYFEKTGMDFSYVGHPVIEDSIDDRSEIDFRVNHNIDKDIKLLCLTAGSRSTELKMLLPIYTKAITLLRNKFPDLQVVSPTIPHLLKEMDDWKNSVDFPVIVITDNEEKFAAYRAANIGLAKSGTNNLEMSIAKLPIVIAYKINSFSYWWIKRLVKINFVNLLNLAANKEIIPECIQDSCTPEILADNLSYLLENKDKADKQIQLTNKALKKLGISQAKSPSDKAAETLLSFCS